MTYQTLQQGVQVLLLDISSVSISTIDTYIDNVVSTSLLKKSQQIVDKL